MSYIKKCNKCGARISMREMSQGQWVAFDVGSDEPHEHGVAGRKNGRALVKKNKTNKVQKTQNLKANKIIDRSGEVHSIQDLPNGWLDLTESNLKKLLMQLIGLNFSVQIEYQDRNGDTTNREIYPLSLIQGYSTSRSTSNSLKVVSYCKLRQDYRTFLLGSIEEIKIDGEIPNTFINKFDSLSFTAQQNILSGANFYGSYYHEPIKTLRDSAASPTPEKLKNIPKPKSKPKPKPKLKPTTKAPFKAKTQPKLETRARTVDYARKQEAPEDEDNIGTWIFWGLLIFVIYNLLG
jgi:hypothetical protein